MLDYYPNLRTNNASAARHRISHDIRIVSSTAASQHKFSHQKIRLASKKPHGSVLPAPPGRESNSGGVRSGLRFGTSDIHCHDFSALASQQLNKLMKAQQPSSWSRGDSPLCTGGLGLPSRCTAGRLCVSLLGTAACSSASIGSDQFAWQPKKKTASGDRTSVILASPVRQPSSVAHSCSSSGPASRNIAALTPAVAHHPLDSHRL